MPFQGNPNAGAPDPALINMLFQQKQRREELAWEREKYQIEAQRQAQLDAADQARKDEIHRFDTLAKRVQLTKDLAEQGANVDSARRNSEQVSAQNFTQEDLFGGGGGEDFASVVAQNDPTAGQQLQESDAAQAFFASQLAGAMPAMQEVSPGVDPVSALLGAGQAVETQRGREASLVEGVKVADAARTNTESDRRAYRDQSIQEVQAQRNQRRQLAQFGDEIITLTDQISAQDKVMATEPPGSPKFQRAQILRARLESGMAKKLTEGVDAGWFDNVEKFKDDNVSLMQEGETVERDLLAFKKLAETDDRFLGSTKGGLISLVSSLTEGASDVASTINGPAGEAISSISMVARDALIRDETISPAQRGKLIKDMGLSEDGVLQARTDAKSLSNRIAYLVTRMQNPGRFANAQYEKNREAYALDTGSAKQAMRNLTTAIAEVQSGNRRTRERLSVYEGLLPGARGGLTTPQGASVFEPGRQTPFQSTTGGPAQAAPAPSMIPSVPQQSPVDALEELMRSAP